MTFYARTVRVVLIAAVSITLVTEAMALCAWADFSKWESISAAAPIRGKRQRATPAYATEASERLRLTCDIIGQSRVPASTAVFMSDVTQILSRIESGDSAAAEQLLPLVYDELRRLAAHRLSQEKPGQTLDATALVHEAYMRLVDVENAQNWNGRGHFFSAAAEAMQRILVDNARRKRRPKHGGDRQRVDIEDFPMSDDRADQLIALEEALQKLASESPEKANLVRLRYFAGLSHQEAASALEISRATADRYWAYAKVFLQCEMEDAAIE